MVLVPSADDKVASVRAGDGIYEKNSAFLWHG